MKIFEESPIMDLIEFKKEVIDLAWLKNGRKMIFDNKIFKI
jgi:hypothetical protein